VWVQQVVGVDSDNVRFRYGLPEKVGGWQSLLNESIVGVVRKQHAFVDNDGNRYVALGQINFYYFILKEVFMILLL
jgi:hypothetical protein